MHPTLPNKRSANSVEQLTTTTKKARTSSSKALRQAAGVARSCSSSAGDSSESRQEIPSGVSQSGHPDPPTLIDPNQDYNTYNLGLDRSEQGLESSSSSVMRSSIPSQKQGTPAGFTAGSPSHLLADASTVPQTSSGTLLARGVEVSAAQNSEAGNPRVSAAIAPTPRRRRPFRDTQEVIGDTIVDYGGTASEEEDWAFSDVEEGVSQEARGKASPEYLPQRREIDEMLSYGTAAHIPPSNTPMQLPQGAAGPERSSVATLRLSSVSDSHREPSEGSGRQLKRSGTQIEGSGTLGLPGFSEETIRRPTIERRSNCSLKSMEAPLGNIYRWLVALQRSIHQLHRLPPRKRPNLSGSAGRAFCYSRSSLKSIGPPQRRDEMWDILLNPQYPSNVGTLQG